MIKSWFNMAADGGTAEIEIYDEIGGWGVNAAEFRRSLKELGDVSSITLRINSPGGDVIDGFAIYNMLLEHPARVTARIDGWAASMAGIVAMAADEVVMPSNTWLMIHNPWTVAVGEADDLRKMADILEKMQAHGIAAYARHATDLSEDDIKTHMDDETWLTGEDAVALGYADTLVEELQIAASVRGCKLSNVPAEAAAWVEPEGDKTVKDEATETAEESTDETAEESTEETTDTAEVTAEAQTEDTSEQTVAELDADETEDNTDETETVADADDAEPVAVVATDTPEGEKDPAWDEGFIAGVASQRTEIATLNGVIEEKDGSIANLSESIGETEEQVKGLEESVDELTVERTDLVATLDEKHTKIAELTQTISDMGERLARLLPGMAAPEGGADAGEDGKPRTFVDLVARKGHRNRK